VARVGAIVDALAGWRFFKALVFVACLLPGALLGYAAYQAFGGGDAMALGVEPITTLLHETGEASLLLLFVTLAITPARRILHANRLQRVRRMLGVWSFTYAVLHVGIYLVFDRNCYSWQACEFTTVWEDIVKRKFIFAGMTAFVILAALATTSTNGWVRRLKKNWGRLHRLVYLAAIAAVVHFFWIQKSDLRRPFYWALVLAGLFAVRFWYGWQKRRAAVRRAVTA
jgi:sulfoxide reductase heme-binding subunit YedZ